MAQSPFQDALARLGTSAVLIPIKGGTKQPLVKAWQSLTLAKTASLSSRRKLEKATAIAVLLGPPSENLVDLDFDADEPAREFITLNPRLDASLRTRGRRGCKIWLRIEGHYPARCCNLKDANNDPIGEWRGGTCYSILSGLHESGSPYRVLVDAPPVTVRYQDISWPSSWKRISLPHAEERSACGKEDQTNSEGEETGKRRLEQLNLLYERYIEHHWTPAPRMRNEFLKKTLPFLFHAMHREAALWMVRTFHQQNASLFRASESEHMEKAGVHLRAIETHWRRDLSKRESDIYSKLSTEPKRAAFRICRDLPRRESNRNDCEDGCFFLSYGDLAARLLIGDRSAWDLMKVLRGRGIVERIKNGTRRKPGVRGSATVWRYAVQPD